MGLTSKQKLCSAKGVTVLLLQLLMVLSSVTTPTVVQRRGLTLRRMLLQLS